jgi:hypothetical protein
MGSDPRLYSESLFVARELDNWNCEFRSCRRILVEGRESREWEYKGVQRSTAERRVSRRMRTRTRMERVLGSHLLRAVVIECH